MLVPGLPGNEPKLFSFDLFTPNARRVKISAPGGQVQTVYVVPEKLHHVEIPMSSWKTNQVIRFETDTEAVQANNGDSRTLFLISLIFTSGQWCQGRFFLNLSSPRTSPQARIMEKEAPRGQVKDCPGAEEQMGDAAILLDPTNHDLWSQAVVQLRRDPAMRESLIVRGKKRVFNSTESREIYVCRFPIR